MEDFIKENFNKMTKQQMADHLGISYNKIDNIIRKMGLRHYKSIKYTDDELNFIKENYPKYGCKYCADKLGRSRIALGKKIKKMGLQINWKYVYKTKDGYLVNCSDRNNRYHIHRKVMEEKLGRKLLSSEIVHHIDGNKLNNDPSNLIIVNRSEHIKLHRKDLKEGHEKYLENKCQYKI